MNHQYIRKEVARLIDRLPRQFREQLRNIEFVVEERPSRELPTEWFLQDIRD